MMNMCDRKIEKFDKIIENYPGMHEKVASA